MINIEKDYFKDRPKESTLYNEIKFSDEIFLCTKAAQKYATKLEHLIRGKVCRKLTKGDHPRGIKCEILTQDGSIAIGRAVYLIRNGKILTKYGLKDEEDVNC